MHYSTIQYLLPVWYLTDSPGLYIVHISYFIDKMSFWDGDWLHKFADFFIQTMRSFITIFWVFRVAKCYLIVILTVENIQTVGKEFINNVILSSVLMCLDFVSEFSEQILKNPFILRMISMQNRGR